MPETRKQGDAKASPPQPGHQRQDHHHRPRRLSHLCHAEPGGCPGDLSCSGTHIGSRWYRCRPGDLSAHHQPGRHHRGAYHHPACQRPGIHSGPAKRGHTGCRSAQWRISTPGAAEPVTRPACPDTDTNHHDPTASDYHDHGPDLRLYSFAPVLTRPASQTRSVRSMGCRAELYVSSSDPDELLDELCALLQRLELAWSRFDPAAELARLNTLPGRFVLTSPLLFDALRTAADGARATGGLFNPLVGASMTALGYDASWLTLDLNASRPEKAAPLPWIGTLQLTSSSRLAFIPPGSSVDLGGVGKGLAADHCLEFARRRGAGAVSVSIGGDLACLRSDPNHPPFPCRIDGMDRVLAVTSFDTHGAIATSAPSVRRFSDGRHHVIDPRTGDSSRSVVRTASVLGGSAAWAEMLATALVIADPDEGLDLARKLDMACVLELYGGEVLFQNATHHQVGS